MLRQSAAKSGDATCRSRRRIKSRWALIVGWPLVTTRVRMSRRFAMASSVLFASAVAVWYPIPYRDSVTTDDAYVRADLTPLVSHVEGYLVDVPIRDNQRVRSGDLLALVQDADYREKVAEAQAKSDLAAAALVESLSQKQYQQIQVEAAAASLRALHAELDRAVADHSRYHALLPSGSVSRQQVDGIDADVKRLSANLAQRRAEWMAAQQREKMSNASINKARANLQAAQSSLNLRNIDLGWTRITSPVDGVIGERHVRPGMYVRTGTLIADVVPLPHVWVVANFRESEITHIRPGQRVTILVDSLPGRAFEGKVDSLQPASGAQFALLPADNATGNFTKVVQRFPVKITLDPSQDSQSSLLPGMSVTTTIHSSTGLSSGNFIDWLTGWLRGRV